METNYVIQACIHVLWKNLAKLLEVFCIMHPDFHFPHVVHALSLGMEFATFTVILQHFHLIMEIVYIVLLVVQFQRSTMDIVRRIAMSQLVLGTGLIA